MTPEQARDRCAALFNSDTAPVEIRRWLSFKGMAVARDAIMALTFAPPASAPADAEIEQAAERVRDAWVAWAHTQPNPKPSWLVPWGECDETTKDADRWIARALLSERARR